MRGTKKEMDTERFFFEPTFAEWDPEDRELIATADDIENFEANKANAVIIN